jgi:flagellar biosynthesis protein FliQ
LYAFLPITQLSILESASLVNPLSGPILRSLHHQFLLWCTFYLMTFVISLIVAIILASVQVDHPTLVFIIAAVLIAFATFLYMRLLGRLAWACQMPPLGHETGDEKPENSASEATDRSGEG